MITTDQRFTEWRTGYLKARLHQERSFLKQIDGWVGVDPALIDTARQQQADIIAWIEKLIADRKSEVE